jgi:hypothetical protein
MAAFADMLKQAKKDVQKKTSSDPKDQAGAQDEGIQIEIQDVEHIRGQAKSGDE